MNSLWRHIKYNGSLTAHYATVDVSQIPHTNHNTGLSSSEALYRRKIVGLNELAIDQEDSMLSKFIDQFKNPLILLLFGSAFISVLLKQYDDAISIALAITIVVTLAFVQEYRSEKSLQALNKLVPHYCHVLRDGQLCTLLASELVPGDIVQFSTGDRVPADVRLSNVLDLEVDESGLTGENKPVKKHHHVIDGITAEDLPLAERKNCAFMGTLVRSGHGVGIVVGTGKETEFGIIFSMMKEVEVRKTPLQEKMDLLGKQLSALSFIIIGVIVLVGVFQERGWLEMFTIGVSLAVAAIPEGLPIVVTVTLALGVLRMAKRHAIVKKLPSVEGLGSVNVICADKTGTLTLNKMTVTVLYTWDEVVNIEDIEARDQSNLSYSGRSALSELASSPPIQMLLKIGSLCNNAHISDESHGLPTEIALLELNKRMGVMDDRANYTRLNEIPFNSDRKFMSVQCKSNQHYDSSTKQGLFFAKGALETLLLKCTSVFVNDRESKILDENVRARIIEVANQVSKSDGGLRCLGFSVGEHLENMTFVGFAAMSDPPRQGVGESIRKLISSGVKVVMITGDSESTAVSVAQRLGIYEPHQNTMFDNSTSLDTTLLNSSIERSSNTSSPVYPNNPYIMSGRELDTIPSPKLERSIEKALVFFRTTPKHKMIIVQALQKAGHCVAMTGDGVNDAPALRLADIGISMGKSGTDVSKEAADVILVDDDISTIVYAMEEGKSIFYNIQNFLRFQLSTSMAALTLIALTTFLGFHHNPLNAMQILWINILCDGPVAQSLGVEEVDPDVMKRKSRPRNDPIITRAFINRVLISVAMMVTGTMIVYVKEIIYESSAKRLTTMTFTCFVLFDLFNSLTSRSSTRSIFSLGFFTNRVYNMAVSLSLFGQLTVIYFPFFQNIFQTEALGVLDLLTLTVLASSVFFLDELRKLSVGKERYYGFMDGVKGNKPKVEDLEALIIK